VRDEIYRSQKMLTFAFAVILGLATAVLADSIIRTILLIISVRYLVYPSLNIALASSKIAFIHIRKLGVISGLMRQFINPTEYAANTALFSGFAFYPESLIVETGIKLTIANFIWLFLHCLWLFVGLKVNSLELFFRTQRLINLSIFSQMIFFAKLWRINKYKSVIIIVLNTQKLDHKIRILDY